MVSLLKAFFEDIQYGFFDNLEKIEPNFEIDNSEFVVVDGEEGDYGLIKYSLDGIHIATKVVEGGDSEYYEWTETGKAMLHEWLVTAIRNAKIM